MAGDFLAGGFLAHRVIFGDFMAGNFLAGDFLGGYRIVAVYPYLLGYMKNDSQINFCNLKILLSKRVKRSFHK